jgi:hypothetical protein
MEADMAKQIEPKLSDRVDAAQVFIIWSGPPSNQLAMLLNEWLPRVIQGIKPFVSQEMAKGKQWANTLMQELARSDFAIVCATPDNQLEPWLNFEAGAARRALTDECVCPLLYGFKQATDLKDPLGIFQATMPEIDDIFRLLQRLNDQLSEGRRLEEKILKGSFDKWWPDFESGIKGITTVTASRELDEKELLRQTLAAVRDQSAAIEEIRKATTYKYVTFQPGSTITVGPSASTTYWDFTTDLPSAVGVQAIPPKIIRPGEEKKK